MPKGIDPSLLKQAAAVAALLEKAAVIPPGGDPSMGGDPAAGGAPPMDPSMAGGAPPPGDPAAGGAPAPTDPALAAAGGGPNEMIQQAVQQALAAAGVGQGGAGAPGAAGAGGKQGKPDVAVELKRCNDMLYKLGVLVTAIVNNDGIEVPSSVLFNQAPETLDPAIAQAADQVTIGGAAGGAPGGDPAAAGGDPSAMGGAPPMDPAAMAGAPKQASAAEKVKLAFVDFFGDGDDDEDIDETAEHIPTYDDADELTDSNSAIDKLAAVCEQPDDLLTEIEAKFSNLAEKAAEAPQSVGQAYGQPFRADSRQPLALARQIRERVRSR